MAQEKTNRKTSLKLPFRSLFLHAWDLAEDGPDAVMPWMANAGLNTACLAATYHSGWFLHPSSQRHRAFMTEGSVCYFRYHKDCYRKTRLQPHLAKIAGKTDWLEQGVKSAGKNGLQLVAWTIGAHNTRLGLEHPDLTQQNVYGDRLPHALCFANDDVAEYLKALCRDLAVHYPLWGIQLEAFGWMGFAHGHHHERDLVGLTPLEQELMSLCFCSSCAAKAKKAGVDVHEAHRVVKNILDAAFSHAPRRPRKHPLHLGEVEAQSDAFRAFRIWRKNFTNAFIREIKQESLRGTSCRLILQTPFDSEIADVVDGFACGAYGQSPAQVSQTCRRFKKSLSRDWASLAQCFIQLGIGVPASEAELRKIIEAVGKSGCNGINFYNRSESPPRMLQWLANVLPDYLE